MKKSIKDAFRKRVRKSWKCQNSRGNLNTINTIVKLEKFKLTKTRYRTAAAVFCMSFFLWQMGLSIGRYTHHSMTTHVTIKQSKEFYLPSVTVCNNHYRFLHMLQQLEAKQSEENFTENELNLFWKSHGIQQEDISIVVTYDFLRQLNQTETELLSTNQRNINITNETVFLTCLGQCVDITLRYPAHQRILGFAIQIKDNANIEKHNPSTVNSKRYYNLYAHHKNMFYINRNFINTRAPQGIELWITFIKKQFIRLNSPNNRCQAVNQHQKCLDKCFHTKISSRVTCKIPSMTAYTDLATCTNWHSVLLVYYQIYRYHATGEIHKCPCIRPCKVTEYQVNRIEYMPFEENFSQISIELENRFDEVVREYYVYSFASLINDFCAIIGFFLGITLPRLIEVVHYFSITVINSRKKTDIVN